MLEILLVWLTTAVSLVIIGALPLGIEIKSFGAATGAAVIFVALNILLFPFFQSLGLPVTPFAVGIFTFLVNILIFAVAALLVKGFTLRWGLKSALFGAIALQIVSPLLNRVVQNI